MSGQLARAYFELHVIELAIASFPGNENSDDAFAESTRAATDVGLAPTARSPSYRRVAA